MLRLIFNNFALTRIDAIICASSGKETVVIIGRWYESMSENKWINLVVFGLPSRISSRKNFRKRRVVIFNRTLYIGNLYIQFDIIF